MEKKDIHNDQELYSYFVQRNATLCDENFSYLMNHKEIKLLLSDYLSSLLLHKPDDVFTYTKDYFRFLNDNPDTNKLLVVLGPGGTGKSFLITKLLIDFPHKFEFPGIVTTDMKNFKFDGRTYHMIAKEKFLELMNEKDIFECVFTNGEYQGMSKKDIDKIAKIDIAGAKRIYNTGIEATYIAILPPSEDKLRERIKNTQNLNTAGINSVLEVCKKQMEEIEECSFISERIINDDAQTAYNDFKNFILSTFPFMNENYQEILNIPNAKLMNLHLNVLEE